MKKTILSLFVQLAIVAGVFADNKQLELTANECFFGPKGTLRAVADKTKKGDQFNREKYLSHIEKWSTINDSIIWYVDVPSTQKIKLVPQIELKGNQAGSKFQVIVGDQKKEVEITASQGANDFQALSFTLSQGLQRIAFVLKKKSGAELGKIFGANITTMGAGDITVRRTRWRPAAVHARMMSSTKPQGVRLVVVEDYPITKDVWAYHPITTPFGYTGVSWDENKQEFGGINFSLWSYSAKGPIPPRNEWSQLISVGKGLTISGFDHEGTGVKPRGDNPYAGVKTERAVIAIRMEPGVPYDTFYAYYLNPEGEDKWEFYGCGKKYNKKGKLQDLWTGKFVEVIGPPEIGRTGHRQRVVGMKGWCVTKEKQVLPLDELHYAGNNDPQMTSKVWSSEDDKFYMKTGGFSGTVVPKGKVVKQKKETTPFYLQGEMLNQLYQLPTNFGKITSEVSSSSSVKLSVEVLDLGTNAVATLYWGNEDGLTYDNKGSGHLWKNKKVIQIKKGKNTFTIDQLSKGGLYWRLMVKNDQGETWLGETQKVNLP